MENLTTESELILDGTKIAWHQERVEAWERGERIAPVTIDMALTRACNYGCHFCYAMLQENDRSVINQPIIYDFLEELQAKLQPGSTFEVSDAMHHQPHGTPYAWIIDDLMCVLYQYKAITVINWILAEALKHGLHCNMPKFHVWITGRPEDNVSFVEALQARGVEYSYDGLRRLLGAPIGSPSFCVKPGGHLDGVVTKASALIGQIMQIDHAQVQYLLLRF